MGGGAGVLGGGDCGGGVVGVWVRILLLVISNIPIFMMVHNTA